MKKIYLTALVILSACTNNPQAIDASEPVSATHTVNQYQASVPCSASDSRHGICPKGPKQ